MKKAFITSFKKNRPDIVNEWSSLVRKSTRHYKDLSLKETKQSVGRHLDAIIEVLDNENFDALNDFLDDLARIRLRKGFNVKETQLAFLHGQTVILRHLDKLHGNERLFCLDCREITDLFIKTQVMYSNIFKEIQLEQKTDAYLRELEFKDQRFSSLTDSTHDAVIGLDDNLIIRSWNKSAEVMYKYRANEIIGKSIGILFSEEQRVEGELYTIEMILRSRGVLKNYKTERTKKDGKKLIVNISSALLKDKNDNTIGFSSVHHDLTEKIQLEHEMRSQEQYLSSIVDHSVDAIIGLDLKDRIVSWNEGAENIFGYTKKEVIGQHFKMLLPAEAIESGEVERIDRELRRVGFIKDFETGRITKSGERIITS